MISEDRELNEGAKFRTGREIRVLFCSGREMAVPEACIATVKTLGERQSAKYLKQGRVRLKDFGGFWTNLSQEFSGPLAGYNNNVLKKMALPVVVPKGIGLSELPDSKAVSLVVLSLGDWHGVMLSSLVHEQPILLGNFTTVRNGDVAGEIERSNLDAILLIDVVSLLKREGFLTVFE